MHDSDTVLSVVPPERTCKNCKKPESEFPMCFRNGDWCSDDCRKIIIGEVVVDRASVHAPDPVVRINSKQVL